MPKSIDVYCIQHTEYTDALKQVRITDQEEIQEKIFEVTEGLYHTVPK